MSFRPRTILRLPSRTSAMSIAKPSCVMPNSLLRRKYDATLALWMMFLLGKHAMFGHDPPMYLRSITATRFPSPAKVHAAIVDPVAPPRISSSTFSTCGCLDIWTDEAFCVLFMLIPSRKLLHCESANADLSGQRRAQIAAPGQLNSFVHATSAVAVAPWPQMTPDGTGMAARG